MLAVQLRVDRRSCVEVEVWSVNLSKRKTGVVDSRNRSICIVHRNRAHAATVDLVSDRASLRHSRCGQDR